MRGLDSQTTRRTARDAADGSVRVSAYWDGGYVSATWAGESALVVGRSPDCGIRIPHPSVSRKHARLTLGPPVAIEDLGSANGTRVAGHEVEQGARAELLAGALVEVGDALLVLRATADDAVAGTPPAADMRQVRELVKRVASGNIPVTLVGETGVGKELLAETVHHQSSRARAPFLRINCAALPEQLLESELFGYERGAFTGASQAKPGLLEAAHGGTVFLDEAGELPRSIQAKLLRALECKELFRVGSLRPRSFDVRFVAATNRDLSAMVAAGEFRADLFHRLCGVLVQVPPLRERRDELAPLAERFIREVAAQLDRPVPIASRAFIQALERYAWPGNVRELKHTMECAVLLATGMTLEPAHLPRAIVTAPASQPRPEGHLRGELEELEKRRILDALERCGGNQTRASKVLGIPRRTLIDRLEVYGVPRPRRGRVRG